MGDWAVIDMHVEVDTHLSVSEGHYIAEQIAAQVKAAHRVAECTVHIDPGTVRHLARVLALPPRAQVQALALDALGRPATLRLHYLDSGLEVEAELAAHVSAAELQRLQRELQAALAGLGHVSRVSLRCPPAGAHA